MFIDAHAHVIPAGFPAREGFPVMDPVAGDTARTLIFGTTRYRARDVYFDTERRLEAMDRGGVDEEIISPMPPLLNYSLDPALGRDLSRFVNEDVALHVRAAGGRIHGLGMVPLQDVSAAAEELSTFAGLGLVGVEVATQVAGAPISDVRFVEFFQEVDRLGLSVFIHTLPRADEIGLPPQLRGSIGVGVEAARAAASLMLGELAEHCMLERVLFSHAAGGLPLMLARADYFWQQRAHDERPPEPPSVVARRFFYDSMLFDPRGLRFAIDYLGTDRLVLGTDFPAMPRPDRLARILDDVGLEGEDRRRIAFDNARAFLGRVESTVDR